MSKGSKKLLAKCQRLEHEVRTRQLSDDPMALAICSFYRKYLAKLRVEQTERFK
jgi:hypothetical protein